MTLDDEIRFCKHLKEFIQTPEAIEQHRQNQLHKIKDDFYVIKKQFDIYKKAEYPCQEAFEMALRDAGYNVHSQRKEEDKALSSYSLETRSHSDNTTKLREKGAEVCGNHSDMLSIEVTELNDNSIDGIIGRHKTLIK